MASFFKKLKSGLGKTRRGLVDNVAQAVTGRANIDDEVLEELENILIAADLGFDMTTALLKRLARRVGFGKGSSRDAVVECMKEFLTERLYESNDGKVVFLKSFYAPKVRPYVLMVVGVNGVGKTTTIAKLANQFRQKDLSVLVAAADTFRAAASEQLEIWAERAQVDIIKNKAGTDPSSVVFDALQAAKSRNTDVVIVDTAGRLHNKSNLMNELNKMIRVTKKVIPAAPHDIYMVLDANTGQNGLRQAEVFTEAAGVTGLVITKLDGTAKGGILFSIQDKLKIPVRFIGIGEGMDDLQVFEPKEFVDALFGENE